MNYLIWSRKRSRAILLLLIGLWLNAASADTLDIVYPESNTALVSGQTVRVLWDSDRLFEDLDILLVGSSQTFVLFSYYQLCNPYIHIDGNELHYADCTLPNVELCDAEFRITGRSYNTCYDPVILVDQSDPISLRRSGVPNVTLTEPDGGEIWNVGDSEPITWTNAGGSANDFVIELSLNGGSSYSIVLDTASTCDRSFLWNPVSFPTTQARVRIRAVSSSGSDSDASGNFTIHGAAQPPVIDVLSPNGGETWELSSTQTITWQRTGGGASSYSIKLSTNNGATYPTTLVSGLSGAALSWPWQNVSPVGANRRIKVIADWTGGQVEDASDAGFAISSTPQPPAVTLTSPNGGENWSRNSVRQITWSISGGNPSSFDIAQSRNGGASYATPFVSGLSGSIRNYDWTVSGPCESDVRIRVTAHWSGGTANDNSNSNFAITGCGGGGGGGPPLIVYVNAAAPPGGNGSAQAPFQTIDQAIAAIATGGTIIVAAGTYAEPSAQITRAMIIQSQNGTATIGN